MAYTYNIAQLAKMEKPVNAPTPVPYDFIDRYSLVALTERVEALVDQMVILNVKMTELIATQPAHGMP